MESRDGSGSRDAIVNGYRALAAAGMMHGSSGNVSVRTADGMLITPSGIDAVRLAAGTLVEMSLDGDVQGAGLPSSEWRMHAAIYRRFPQAGAIVHTHADACVALACLRSDLPAFHYMVAGFGGDDVRCAAYAPFGSARLAELAADAMERRSALRCPRPCRPTSARARRISVCTEYQFSRWKKCVPRRKTWAS